MISTRVSTRVADMVYIKEENILYITMLEDAEVGLLDAMEIVSRGTEMTKDVVVLVFADVRALKSISHEAREYFVKQSALRLAEAIMVGSIATRLVANFYIQFHKPPNPVKIFSVEDEALRWLKNKT